MYVYESDSLTRYLLLAIPVFSIRFPIVDPILTLRTVGIEIEQGSCIYQMYCTLYQE